MERAETTDEFRTGSAKAVCFAGSTVPDAMIAAMRSGKQLKIVFYNANEQAITVTLPLAGFALAYDKIKG